MDQIEEKPVAELTTEQRGVLWADCMKCMRPNEKAVAMTKSQYRQAIDTVDTWLNNNRTTLLAIFPSPSNTALTDAEKIQMIADVAARRVATGVE